MVTVIIAVVFILIVGILIAILVNKKVNGIGDEGAGSKNVIVNSYGIDVGNRQMGGNQEQLYPVSCRLIRRWFLDTVFWRLSTVASEYSGSGRNEIGYNFCPYRLQTKNIKLISLSHIYKSETPYFPFFFRCRTHSDSKYSICPFTERKSSSAHAAISS